MEREENAASGRFEDVIGDVVSPQEFWQKLAGVIAGKWALPQVFLLHVASAAEVRLLGQHGSVELAVLPDAVRRVIAAERPQSAQSIHADGGHWLVAPLENGDGVPLLLIAGGGGEVLGMEALQLMALAQALIAAFEARQSAKRSERAVANLSQILDLGLLLGESLHFDAAALTLCNEIAIHSKAMRVTLGWVAGDKLKLMATSHGGRVRNDTEEAGSILRVMEEAHDQDLEVAVPALETEALFLQHGRYSQAHANCRVLSLPIRFDGKPVGVLTIEHSAEDDAITQDEIEALRVVLDLVAPRLEERYRHTGWFGARLWRRTRRGMGRFIGYRHTGWKCAALFIFVVVALALVIPMEHRVKATFILKAEASAYLTAPFSSYIDKVYQDVGDVVEKDALLLDLDRRELLVQRSELAADRNRGLTDARRLEGEGELTEMLLSQLSVKQVDAKMRVLDYRLSRTAVRAPFDGIIVEGDLRERLFAPVQAGETLYRIVQLEGLFGELQVDERDINFLKKGMDGEISFASRPYERYGVELGQFEPVAIIEETGTYFRVRVHVLDKPDDWWRPGMSGLCKINAGKRSVAWVFTHRTIEYLRLVFWF
jgi:multidrug efflux pump subunit AcrA (membrane-fusion protein)/GAF domain-containing protein